MTNDTAVFHDLIDAAARCAPEIASMLRAAGLQPRTDYIAEITAKTFLGELWETNPSARAQWMNYLRPAVERHLTPPSKVGSEA